MKIERMMPRSLAGTLVMALAMGCGNEDPTDPGGGGAVPAEVDEFLSTLPSWSTFTADVNGPDQAPTPVGPPEAVADEVVSVSEVEEDGSVTVIPDVTYRCTETPYTLRKNPERIVMYSPDIEVLWPGSLIQGKSRKELGSLLGLTIRERTPIRVSIPAFANNDNFREVPEPDQATVAQAIGSMVGNATETGLSSPSTITFKMDAYNSESSFGLSVDVSGHYLGFSGSATGDVSRNSSETTISAHFYQKMFEVVVAPPQTPGAFFSEDFTEQKMQEQIDLGRMGPDNIPVYISNVVYGRMMMFSFTSSASESDIRGTIQAAYEGIGGGVSGSLSVRQQKILSTAKIAVTSLGGNAQATLDVIRSGDWSAYFTDEATLSSASPLSYTFRNLGDGSIAGVTEATEYNIRSCQAIPATPGTFAFLDPQVEAAPFSGGVQTRLADVNGDGRMDFVWNQLQQGDNRLYVGMSAGDGTFSFTAPVAHPEAPSEGWGNFTLDVADINGDAYADLVWNYLGTPNKTYFGIGNGDGTFAFPSVRIHPAEGWGAYRLLVGDAAGPTGVGDGLDDLIWARSLSSTLGVYMGMSQGNSQIDYRDWRPLTGTYSVAWHDRAINFDGDGDVDVVLNAVGSSFPATTNQVYVVESAGNDTWTRRGPFNNTATANWHGFAVRTGDVDGLGSQSLIWADTASVDNKIAVGRWTGSTYQFLPTQSAQYRDPSDPPMAVRVGDVDGDGDADLIWNSTSGTANRTYVSLGQGDGSFDFSALDQLHPDTQASWPQYTIYVADVNGDGRDDMIWNWAAATNRIYTAIGKK
jgi:hypothetical protein